LPLKPSADQTPHEEIAQLRARLEEAEDLLRAIRSGEVDALLVESPTGPQVFTLQGLDAESNRFRGEILDQVSDAVIAVDDDQRVTYLNAAAARQYGVSDSEVLGHRLSEVYEVRWLNSGDEAAAATTLRENNHWRGEELHVTRDGEVICVEASVTRLHTGRGARPGLLSVIRDITERKEAEAALRQNAALFAKVVEQAPGGVYVVDAQFRVHQVNPKALPVFASAQPLIGRDFDEVLAIVWGPEFGSEIGGIFRHTLTTGEQYISSVVSRVRHDINEEQAYEWETQRVTLPDGQYGVICYFTDVTERLRAENALRESEERMRLATEATGVGIWEWNVRTDRIRWDAQMFRIYGIEPTADGFVPYSKWSGAVVPQDLPEQEAILRDTVHRIGRSSRSFRIRRDHDGARCDIDAVETVRTNAQGQAEWVVGTNLDVTDRQEAEAELKASLHEKDVLLSEVHHRVKNNLQIVSSLLNLQARRITDPAMIAVFASTRDRVWAMAAVHQQLYERGNFAQINLALHLEKLTRMLMQAHAVTIEPVLELAPVAVNLKVAVPLSLIANELIVNSLKYAFLGRRKGTLTVGLQTTASGSGLEADSPPQHELRISDDGPGIPLAFDVATTTTLGLRLVRDLSRQIRGEVEIENPPIGTSIVVRWPMAG
jgi:PAS domain S-box-containing protein